MYSTIVCITMAKRTNPNGANQWVVDPRQELFLSYYLDPNSETWSNATKSALKAGYGEEYSQNLTGQNPVWLSEKLGDNALLKTALVNLDEFLNTSDEKHQNIRWDATKTVLKSLQRTKWGDKVDPTTNNIFVKEIIINKANESDH